MDEVKVQSERFSGPSQDQRDVFCFCFFILKNRKLLCNQFIDLITKNEAKSQSNFNTSFFLTLDQKCIPLIHRFPHSNMNAGTLLLLWLSWKKNGAECWDELQRLWGISGRIINCSYAPLCGRMSPSMIPDLDMLNASRMQFPVFSFSVMESADGFWAVSS